MQKLYVLIFALMPLWVFAQTPEPQFSVRGGIYDSPFSLEITAEGDGVSIYYTTDGATPSSGSRRYSSPISISKTHVIRARVYQNGRPGKVITQSYFLERSYSVPVVSIATDTANLWSWSRGIYVKGPGAAANYPFNGANFHKDWERLINIEYYEPDNTVGFNQEAGMKIFGGWSRPLPQKSLAIMGRKRYGNKYFRHKIFPDKDITRFKGLVLRNSGSDWNQSMFRDAFITSLVKNGDMEMQAYVPTAVYLNGKYWGIHNLREKINEHYIKHNCGVHPDSVDMLKYRSGVRAGSAKHYKKMLQYLRTNDLAVPENYEYIKTQMDVENYSFYNIIETYIDNHDAGGNIRYWRPQTPDGRWRWILFDTDFGFAIGNKKAYKTNTLRMFTDPHGPKWPNPPWSTFVIRKLLANEEFKQMYINMWCDHLNTTFHPEVVKAQLDFFHEQYKTEMPYHKERWGGTMESWEKHVARMQEFGAKRPPHCRKHLMEYFELPDTAYVAIKANDASMGEVHINLMKLDSLPFEGIYFHNNPITIRAVPKFDYEFVRWEGYESTDPEITVSLTGDLAVEAIFRKKNASPHTSVVMINEVVYSDKEGQPVCDWIELYNHGDAAMDLSGWIFKDDREASVFQLPEGTSIPSRGYVLLARDDTLLTALPDSLTIIAAFDFGLSSNGDVLRLYDKDALPVDVVAYTPPEESMALGLHLLHPDSSGNDPTHFAFIQNFSPGGMNPPYSDTLAAEDSARKMTNWLMIGGGAVLLIGGLLFFLIRRKKKRNAEHAATVLA